MNVQQVILDINLWLKHGSGYTATTTYKDIMQYFTNASDGESFALRLLIHYVGDIHQPCHSIARVDSTYPAGDNGCNSVSLPSLDAASNLHAVWDSVLYEEPGTQTLPFSSSTWSSYGTLAASIATANPVPTSAYHNSDPAAWSAENSAYAPTLYSSVTPGKALTSTYIASA